MTLAGSSRLTASPRNAMESTEWGGSRGKSSSSSKSDSDEVSEIVEEVSVLVETSEVVDKVSASDVVSEESKGASRSPPKMQTWNR